MTRSDSHHSLLIGGSIAVGLGAFVVLAELGLGWVGAVVLGVVLILVARTVPASARVLSVVLTALGIVALAGAVVALAA